MARFGTALALSSLAVVCWLAAPAPARAQEAHCQWLKIKVAGKGYELDEARSALGPKRAVKSTCYAQLVFVAPSEEFPNGRYTAPLICAHGANDDWEPTDAANGLVMNLLADGDAISDDDFLTFHAENGDVIQGFASHVLDVTLDKEGVAFKKAKWKTLGAQMIDQSVYFRTPADVFGGYAASGASVPEEKVPEPVLAVMSSGMCP